MRITGRQLRRIIQEEVTRMMNEAPDMERKKIDLLTSIAGGRVIRDTNATTDELLVINAMLDDYIKKSKNPKLQQFLTNTLPTSPIDRKLRAVQADLRIGVDGAFGEESIMGLVRSSSPATQAYTVEDILDMLRSGEDPLPPSASADELGALVRQGNAGQKSADLGPGIVGSTGTGSKGVDVGKGPKVQPSSRAQVVQSAPLQLFTNSELADIKRVAAGMYRRGEDPIAYIQSKLGAKSAASGRTAAAALLSALDIEPQQ